MPRHPCRQALADLLGSEHPRVDRSDVIITQIKVTTDRLSPDTTNTPFLVAHVFFGVPVITPSNERREGQSSLAHLFLNGFEQSVQRVRV